MNSGARAKAIAARRRTPMNKKLLTTMVVSILGAGLSSRGGNGLHLCVVVDGHDRQLAIVAPEAKGRLLAVRGLATHLDPADWAVRFELHDSLDLSCPLLVANPNLVRD